MAENVGGIEYTITINTQQFIAQQREIQRRAEQTAQSLETVGRGGARSMDAATRSANGLATSLRQVAAAVSLYSAASYLITQSDAYTKLTAQLKLATANTAQLATAQAAVIAIAQESQVALSGVGTLYARITSSTKELGISQETVGEITRSVALALKVSGATATEAASATLQLSQAFASGVLRGEEFNAVNEAAPRLMLALADGIGVPVGALRKMAEAGLITSEVMAKALPDALASLEKEAKQIQTIGGAFQQLKNEATLFIGQTSEQSGAVKLLTGTIGLLADNLTLLVGVMGTVAAVKMASYLASAADAMIQTTTASRALVASTLATAQADAAATAATSVLTAARVNELRAAVAAASGETALAITVNGLVPAQARAAAAADAHAASLLALSAAQRAASATGTVLSGALRLLGGPLGAIITVLGLGATAWAVWGSSAKDASDKAAKAVEETHDQVVKRIDEQNKKLRERIALSKQAGGKAAAVDGGADAEKLAATLAQINAIKAKGSQQTRADQLDLIELEGQYRDLNGVLKDRRDLDEEIKGIGEAKTAAEWMKKYATETERANAEVAKAKKELGSAFTPELETRIRGKIDKPKNEKKPFDQAGYLADQQARAASAWDKIDIDEAEAVRKSNAHLKAKEISEATHAEDLKAIRETAAKQRRELSQKELDDLVQSIANDERLKDEAERREQQRQDDITRARQGAMAAIADATEDPVLRIRLEEDRKLAELAAWQAKDLENTQLYQDAKTAIETQAAKAREDAAYTALQNQVSSASNAFGSIADITRGFAGEQNGIYRAMFAVSKGFAIAESIIKIQQGIANAAALPFPANIPAMATVAASTSSIVSTISGTNFGGGRQYGGPVSTDSLYRVNERGAPEMYTASNGTQYMLPTANGNVTAANKIEGGGSVQWNIVVNNTAAGTMASASVDQQSRTVQIAVTEVAQQISNNSGPVWSAMRGSTNIRSAL